MAANVLLVHPDSRFLREFSIEMQQSNNEISVHTASRRSEASAIAALKQFDYVVMSLEIPRLTDGYLFIGRELSKIIAKKRIIVLVHHKTDAIISSLHALEVENIYTYDNKNEILNIFHSNRQRKTNTSDTQINTEVTAAAKPIHTALCHTMGPVGAIIYKKAVQNWHNTSDLSELIGLVAKEIGDKQQVSRFETVLQELRRKRPQ